MPRRRPSYVITTVRGKKPGGGVDASQHLDFKCEAIANGRAATGYELQEVVPVSSTCCHLVMVKR